MNKILIILSFITSMCCISSCCAIREVPINTTKVDSVRIERVVEYRDSIVYVDVPREIVREVVPELDTLFMENTVATSRSYLDTTTRTLKGELKSKPAKLPQPVKLPETTEKEEIIREVVIEKPVTVEVEKRYIPHWCWYSLIANVAVLMLLGFRLYLKFKP